MENVMQEKLEQDQSRPTDTSKDSPNHDAVIMVDNLCAKRNSASNTDTAEDMLVLRQPNLINGKLQKFIIQHFHIH